jgi:hypothetical protein
LRGEYEELTTSGRRGIGSRATQTSKEEEEEEEEEEEAPLPSKAKPQAQATQWVVAASPKSGQIRLNY